MALSLGPPALKLVNKTFTIHFSDIVSIAVGAIIMTDIDSVKPHCFAGIQFFQDGTDQLPTQPTGGLLTVTVQTVNSAPRFEDVPANAVLASKSHTVSWGANTNQVQAAIGTSISGSGVTHYRLVVTSNES